MASVRWTLNGNRNLLEILRFLAERSPGYSVSLYERINTAVLSLEHFPRIGRAVQEYGDDSARELIFDNYRLHYSFEADQVASSRWFTAGEISFEP